MPGVSVTLLEGLHHVKTLVAKKQNSTTRWEEAKLCVSVVNVIFSFSTAGKAQAP